VLGFANVGKTASLDKFYTKSEKEFPVVVPYNQAEIILQALNVV